MADVNDTNGQLVVFSLGGDEYALPIGRVQEIIRYTEPRTVASDVPSVRGVISLRGKIVPVCDLSSQLGSAPAAGDDDGKIVIVETGGGTAGIMVDDVAEVLTYDDADLDDVPGAGDSALSHIVKIDDRLIVLLDIDAIFGGVELAVAA